MTYRDTLFPQRAYGLSLVDTLQEDLIVGDLFYGNTHKERRREALYVYDLGDSFSHALTLEDENELLGWWKAFLASATAGWREGMSTRGLWWKLCLRKHVVHSFTAIIAPRLPGNARQLPWCHEL
jgi:hypothetical protein